MENDVDFQENLEVDFLFINKPIFDLYDRIILKDLGPHYVNDEKALKETFKSLMIVIEFVKGDKTYHFSEIELIKEDWESLKVDKENKYLEILPNEGSERNYPISYLGDDEFCKLKSLYYEMVIDASFDIYEKQFMNNLKECDNLKEFEFLIDKNVSLLLYYESNMLNYQIQNDLSLSPEMDDCDGLIMNNLKKTICNFLKFIFLNYHKHINQVHLEEINTKILKPEVATHNLWLTLFSKLEKKKSKTLKWLGTPEQLAALFDELKNNQFISEETDFKFFQKVFSGKEHTIKDKIDWKSTGVLLSYLIGELVERKCIDDKSFWSITENVFTKSSNLKQAYNNSKNNKKEKPKNSKKIDLILKDLKNT